MMIRYNGVAASYRILGLETPGVPFGEEGLSCPFFGDSDVPGLFDQSFILECPLADESIRFLKERKK